MFTTTAATALPDALACYYGIGYPVNINVPPGALTMLQAHGGVSHTSTSTLGGALIDAALVIDGVPDATAGAYQREIVTNTVYGAQFRNYHLQKTYNLAPGSHSVGVCYFRAGITGTGNAATGGGNSTQVTQGILVVNYLKQ